MRGLCPDNAALEVKAPGESREKGLGGPRDGIPVDRRGEGVPEGVRPGVCDYQLPEVFYFYVLNSGNSGRLTRVRLQQPQERRYPVLKVHAESFRVSVIH